MRKTSFFAIMLLTAMQISALTDIPEGNVNGTWTQSGSPYRIQGDVTIGYEDSLTIEAGVIVDFEGHYRFMIRGVLTALGTVGDSIRFTRLSNDGLMAPDTVGLADTSNQEGAWKGIEWATQLGSVSNLSHCIFEFINTVDNSLTLWNDHLAPLQIRNSGGVYFTNSVIRNNHGGRGGGIFATDFVFIDSCLIMNNRAYHMNGFELRPAGGIHIYYSNSGEVTNCVITNNKSDGSYSTGGIRIESGSPLIMNNVISNNISYSNSQNAGGIYSTVAYPMIIQNLIVNNESGYTGGIYFDGGGGKLYNNTICNNKSNGNKAGGVTFEGASGTIAMNNIFYGNENGNGPSQIVLGSISTQPVVKYNLIGDSIEEIGGNDNGAIIESDNYFGDPSLVNPTGAAGIGNASKPEDWQLTTGSIMINQGNNDPVKQASVEKDIAGNRRINYGYVDPGCHELRIESYMPDSIIYSPEIWIADTVHVTRTTDLRAKVTIYPGVVILSHGHYDIYARDSLYAIGTVEAPILWTVKDTTGFSNPDTEDGGWGSIMLSDTYPRIFSHCVFEFGKVNQYVSGRTGLIWGFNNGNMEVDNCVFRDCYAIHASLVRSTKGANLTVSSSKFYNNTVTSSDAIIYLKEGSNFIVRDNQIFNNVCTQRIIHLSGANYKFINNSIYHNIGEIEITNSSNVDFINNTILKNTRISGLGFGDNSRIINSILTDFNVSHVDLQIISSYAPSQNLRGAHVIEPLTIPPVFNNPLPYSGTGPLEEILKADYSLSSISPGINFGSKDTVGLNLSKTDLYGNPRIHDGRIDIGAYENQGSLPVLTGQPAGGTFCVGENHIMKVEYEGSDTVLFKWFRDGADISQQGGDNTLELNSIQISDEGNYHCEISNSYGKVLSSTVYIKVNFSPDILVQPEDTWHESGIPLSMSVVFTGSSPITFQWEKDGELILGEDLPEYRFTPADSSMEGNYVCTVSNTCDTVKTDPAALYLSPQLCMVTVSSTTGNNLVVWEKKSKAPIMAYQIYRESIAAGIYDRLATISYDDLSVFVDTSADPTVQAYLYKITALDTAGIETDIDLCRPHKTIHLLVTTNPELNTTQLAWDRYYGFDYQTYTIYRSSTGVNFDPVHSLSASLNSWTDPSPSVGDLFYRMAVEKPDPCVPEGAGKKAGTGPYQHSLSNMDDNKLKAGQMPPDTIILNNHSIEEENLAGVVIGKLLTEDADSLDSHTYKFVTGEGDDDNFSFTLLGDLLLASESFDYETRNQYKVRIRSTDEAGNYIDIPFIIQILDLDETTGLSVVYTGGVNAFPNPFRQSTTIRFPNASAEPFRLVLTDVSGKLCRIVDDITTSQFVLKRENLRKGLYFLELWGTKTYRAKLVIK